MLVDSKDKRIRNKSQVINEMDPKLVEVIRLQRYWRKRMKLKALRKQIQMKRNKVYILQELFDSEQAYCNNLQKLV